MLIVNKVGQKIGRLTVIKKLKSVIYKGGKKRCSYLCLCDCGKQTKVISDNLKENHTTSCGCLKKENISNGINRRHSLSKSHFFAKFHGMTQRCNNKNNTSYPRYGAKGIKMLWTTFDDFKNDMYASYLEHVKIHGKKNTTIERINSKDNYCKENCKWATIMEQAANRRNNRMVEYNGQFVPISRLEKEKGISSGTLYRQVITMGRSVTSSLEKYGTR